MKKAKSGLNDWSRPEYRRSDLGELVRGKYAKRIRESTNVEAEYHRMKPEDFDEAMAQAKAHKPEARSRSKRKSGAAEKKRVA